MASANLLESRYTRKSRNFSEIHTPEKVSDEDGDDIRSLPEIMNLLSNMTIHVQNESS